MTRATTLEYATQPPPNRYEWEMESERARWLRRRFMWFTGTLVVLAAILLPMSLADMASRSGYIVASGAVQSFAWLVQVLAAGWAWWYARSRVRNERRFFAMAFWLVVGLGVLHIFTSRIGGELALSAGFDHFEQLQSRDSEYGGGVGLTITDDEDLLDASETGEDEAAGTAGAPRSLRATPFAANMRQAMSLGVVSWAVLVSHLVACLFLPWNVREATKPALILLAAAGLVVLVDLLLGRASIWYLAASLFLFPLTVLPGIVWCWWRHSRFTRRFRGVFESKQLRQLTHELSGARRIHEASLPPVFATGPLRLSYIYEPMSQIGGDLLFVHPRPPEIPPDFSNPQDIPPPPRHTLVLLDVTGHGIAAALTVNRLVGELERIFAETPQIGTGALIGALNRYVFLTLATHGVFVTGVAISVDTTEHANCAAAFRDPHAITFASAGHPSAFLRRADGRIESLESNSTMLGVLPPEQYHPEEKVFRLRPGEAIVAYTDGALEARNLEDDMIGIEGVRDLVSEIARTSADPFHWPEQIIRRVAAWRSAPPLDDTLIACVYRPPIPANAVQRAPQREQEPLPEAALAAVG